MDTLSLKKALSLLLEILTKSKARTEKYINMQNPIYSTMLSFSEDIIRSEQATAKAFSAKIVSDIDMADVYAAKISGYICEADEAMNNELTSALSTVFNAYTLYKSTVTEFLCLVDICFGENNDPQFSSLLSGSRRLLQMTDNVCGVLINTINNLKL